MFFFNFLVEYTLLWWVCLVLLLPITLITAVNAHKDRFGVCIVLSLIGAALVHLLGLVDLIALGITAWPWLLGGFALYLLLSFPYARFVEWRRYLVHRYAELEEEAAGQLSYFAKEQRKNWLALRWMEKLDELSKQDPAFDSKSPHYQHWECDKAREKFARSLEVERLWAEYKQSPEFQTACETHLAECELREPIKASEHKALIVGWMVYWPYKLLYRIVVQWMLEFFERIKDLFRIVVERLMHLLQSDSDRAYAKYMAARKEAKQQQ